MGPFWGFMHRAEFQAAWSAGGVVAAFYIAFMVPFRLTFNRDDDLVRGADAFVVLDALLYTFILLGLLQQQLLQPRVRPAESSQSDTQVIYHSKKTRRGVRFFLAFDLLSVIPVPYIAYGAHYHYPEIFYLFLLPHLVHVMEDASTLNSYVNEHNLIRNVNTRRLIWSYMVYVIVIHMAACGFYMVGSLVLEQTGRSTWLVFDGLAESVNGTMHYLAPDSVVYVRSIYWATVSLVTTGFGDITPRTIPECIVATFFFFLGYMGVCLLIATVTNMVTIGSAAEGHYLKKMDEIDEYMHYRQLPRELQARIVSFFQYMWHLLKGVDVSGFIGELPSSLRTQVAGLQTRNLLAKMVYFRNCEESLLNALVLSLRQTVYSPGDEIVGSHKVNKNLYLFTRGEAEMIGRSGSVMKVFGVNQESYYGEWDIFEGKETENAIRARSFCELYVLTSEEFLKIREKYISEDQFSSMLSQLEKAGKQKKVLEKLLGDDFKYQDQRLYRGWRRAFLPDSTFRLYWSLGLLLVVIWNIVIVPIRIAYFYSEQSSSFFLAVSVVDYIVDALYLIDTGLRITCFAFTENGLPNCDARLIRSHYIQNRAGVVADVLGGVPVDLIAYAFDSRVSAFVRLLKLARLYHFGPDLAALTKLLGTKVTINHNIKQIFTFLCSLLATAHYFACFFHFLGWYQKSVLRNERNWIDRDNTNPVYDLSHGEWSHFAGYIRALYQVLLSITTVGYADIPPITTEETIYTAVIILIGGILYPAVVGASATFMNKLGGTRKDFKRKMTNLRRYMEMKKFPAELRKRIIQYYDYIWSRQQGVDELAVLRDLPMIMRSETSQHVVGQALKSVPFIGSCEPDFIKQLYSKIEPATFLPDDQLIHLNEIGSGLFVLKYGMARVESAPVRKERPDYISQFERSLAKLPLPDDDDLVDPDEGLSPRTDVEDGEDDEGVGGVGSTTCKSSRTHKSVREKEEEQEDQFIVYRILYQGSFCGVSSLINVKSTVLVRAITFCDCYMVSKESVQSLLEEFPDSKASFLDEAAEEHQHHLQMYRCIDRNMKKEKLDKLVDTHLSITHVEIPPSSFRHPDSMGKRYWQLLMLFITVYYIFSIPIMLLVLSTVDFSLYFVGWFLDLVVIANFLLNLFVFSFMCEGQIISARSEITRNRVRQWSFYTDLLAIIPWEILAAIPLGMGTDSLTVISIWIPALRFPKLLICLHYSEYSDTLSRLLEEFPSIPEFFATIINLLLSVIIVAHIFASFFMFLGTYGTSLHFPVRECAAKYDKGATTGLDSHLMNQYAACLYSGTWIQRQIETRHLPSGGGSDVMQYIRAFYWSISTLICVVIGDVNPINMVETAYVVLAMIVGVIINSGIIGGIANLVANLEGEEAVYSSKMDELENYFMAHGIAGPLQQKVKRYMEYVRQSTGGFDDALILNDLPSSLKSEVFQMKGYQFLYKCKIFRGLDTSFVRAVSQHLKVVIFSPSEVVYNLHDPLHSIYFIVRGSLAVYPSLPQFQDHKASSLLHSGDYFGEMCVFCEERTSDIAQSVDFLECLRLDQADLNILIRSFNPDVERLYQNLVKLDSFAQTSRTMQIESSRRMDEDGEPRVGCSDSDESSPFTDAPPELNVVIPTYRTFSPRHRFTVSWDTLGFFLIVLQFFSVSYFGAYFDPDQVYHPSGFPFLIVLDTLVTVYWIANAVLHMLFFSYLTEGVLVTDRHQILVNYLKKSLAFDVLVCFPYEVGALVRPELYPFLRLPHLLMLLRYPSLFQKFSQTITSASKAIKPSVVSICNLFFLLLMFVHFCACMHFFLHRFIASQEKLTWAIVDGWSTFDPATGRNNLKNPEVSFSDIYTRAFYYSMNVITTIGYGDIQPFSTAEIFFNIILAIVAASFQAAICGSIAAFLSQRDQTGEAAFNERIHNIMEFMEIRQLPDNLKKSILFYFSKLWEKDKGCVRPRVLGELPRKLQSAISYAIYTDQMKAIDDLISLDPRPREFLSLKLKPYLCNSKEYIYRVGDIGEEVFFIVEGRVHLDSREGSREPEDKERGETFGHEERGVDNVFRQHDARAETFCDLLSISRADLLDAARHFPGIREFPIFENIRAVTSSHPSPTKQAFSSSNAAAPPPEGAPSSSSSVGNQPLDLLKERLRRKMVYLSNVNTQRSRMSSYVNSSRGSRARLLDDSALSPTGSGGGNQGRLPTSSRIGSLGGLKTRSPSKILAMMAMGGPPSPGGEIHLKPLHPLLSGLCLESMDPLSSPGGPLSNGTHSRQSFHMLPIPEPEGGEKEEEEEEEEKPMASPPSTDVISPKRGGRPHKLGLQILTEEGTMWMASPSPLTRKVVTAPNRSPEMRATPTPNVEMTEMEIEMTPELLGLISFAVEGVMKRSWDSLLESSLQSVLTASSLPPREKFLLERRDSLLRSAVSSEVSILLEGFTSGALPLEGEDDESIRLREALAESALPLLLEGVLSRLVDRALREIDEGINGSHSGIVSQEFNLDNEDSAELRASFLFEHTPGTLGGGGGHNSTVSGGGGRGGGRSSIVSGGGGGVSGRHDSLFFAFGAIPPNQTASLIVGSSSPSRPREPPSPSSPSRDSPSSPGLSIRMPDLTRPTRYKRSLRADAAADEVRMTGVVAPLEISPRRESSPSPSHGSSLSTRRRARARRSCLAALSTSDGSLGTGEGGVSPEGGEEVGSESPVMFHVAGAALAVRPSGISAPGGMGRGGRRSSGAPSGRSSVAALSAIEMMSFLVAGGQASLASDPSPPVASSSTAAANQGASSSSSLLPPVRPGNRSSIQFLMKAMRDSSEDIAILGSEDEEEEDGGEGERRKAPKGRNAIARVDDEEETL